VVVGVSVAAAIEADEHAAIPATILTFLFVAVGVMLVSFGLIEVTLDRAADEPTHPRLSPGLKWGFGLSLVAVGVAQPTLSTVVALGVCLAVLAAHAVYGAFVYYRR
jgi:hypothetical protein